jgi:branched-chain amino acid transport system substrate-binding protein
MTYLDRRARAMLPGAIALVLLAAGCGGSSTTGPIKIGFNGELTGDYAPDGIGALQGVTVGINAVNAAGGVMGRKLQVVTGDNRGDPVDAVPVAQQQVSIDNVPVSIGPVGPFLVPTQRIYDKAGTPVFEWGGDSEWDHITDPLIWRVTPSDSSEALAMALYAHGRGYTHAAFVYESNIAEQGLITGILPIWKKFGGTVAITKSLIPSAQSYSSEVHSILAAHPDVIFLSVGVTTAATLFADLRQQNGLSVPIVGDDKSDVAQYTSAIGLSTAEKALVSVASGVYNSPSSKFFNSAYQALEGHPSLGSANYTYDAVNIIALAMEKAHSTVGADFVKAIRDVVNPSGAKVYTYRQGLAALKAGARTIDYVGASGPLQYNRYHNVYGPFAVYKVTDAKGGLRLIQNLSAEQLASAGA